MFPPWLGVARCKFMRSSRASGLIPVQLPVAIAWPRPGPDPAGWLALLAWLVPLAGLAGLAGWPGWPGWLAWLAWLAAPPHFERSGNLCESPVFRTSNQIY